MDNSVNGVRSELEGKQVVSITWVYVLLDLIQPDQPNRAVRTRMLRGVGGALSDGCPYPYISNNYYLIFIASLQFYDRILDSFRMLSLFQTNSKLILSFLALHRMQRSHIYPRVF